MCVTWNGIRQCSTTVGTCQLEREMALAYCYMAQLLVESVLIRVIHAIVELQGTSIGLGGDGMRNDPMCLKNECTRT